jgi:Ca2+-binding EF-hand superfamily protein
MGLLLQEYDEDKSGDLDMKEMTNLITDHEIRNGKDIPIVPSKAEISWILQSVGKHSENAIDVTELELALKLWDAYVRNRAKFEKMFSIKIDTNLDQRLEFDQLKLYLTKLAGYPLKVKSFSQFFALQPPFTDWACRAELRCPRNHARV